MIENRDELLLPSLQLLIIVVEEPTISAFHRAINRFETSSKYFRGTVVKSFLFVAGSRNGGISLRSWIAQSARSCKVLLGRSQHRKHSSPPYWKSLLIPSVARLWSSQK